MGVLTERWRQERRGDGDPDDREGGADCTERATIGRWPSRWPRPGSSTWALVATDEGVQADAVADLEIEEVGEAPLNDHAAVGDPVSCGELRLVDGCGRRIATLGQHGI
jgi:hypothetical protein